MRSMSGAGLQGSKRALDDLPDRPSIAEPACLSRRGEPRIGAEAGIDVDLEDEGLARRIDPEVDAGIRAEPEQAPAGLGQSGEPQGQLGLVLFQPEAPRRADIGLA